MQLRVLCAMLQFCSGKESGNFIDIPNLQYTKARLKVIIRPGNAKATELAMLVSICSGHDAVGMRDCCKTPSMSQIHRQECPCASGHKIR